MMHISDLIAGVHLHCDGKRLGEIHVAAAVLAAIEANSLEAGKRVADDIEKRLELIRTRYGTRVPNGDRI